MSHYYEKPVENPKTPDPDATKGYPLSSNPSVSVQEKFREDGTLRGIDFYIGGSKATYDQAENGLFDIVRRQYYDAWRRLGRLGHLCIGPIQNQSLNSHVGHNAMNGRYTFGFVFGVNASYITPEEPSDVFEYAVDWGDPALWGEEATGIIYDLFDECKVTHGTAVFDAYEDFNGLPYIHQTAKIAQIADWERTGDHTAKITLNKKINTNRDISLSTNSTGLMWFNVEAKPPQFPIIRLSNEVTDRMDYRLYPTQEGISRFWLGRGAYMIDVHKESAPKYEIGRDDVESIGHLIGLPCAGYFGGGILRRTYSPKYYYGFGVLRHRLTDQKTEYEEYGDATITYQAQEGITLSGTTTQIIGYGESGTEVEAVVDTGLDWGGWSDGRSERERTDTGYGIDQTFTAYLYDPDEGDATDEQFNSDNPIEETPEIDPNGVKTYAGLDVFENFLQAQSRLNSQDPAEANTDNVGLLPLINATSDMVVEIIPTKCDPSGGVSPENRSLLSHSPGYVFEKAINFRRICQQSRGEMSSISGNGEKQVQRARFRQYLSRQFEMGSDYSQPDGESRIYTFAIDQEIEDLPNPDFMWYDCVWQIPGYCDTLDDLRSEVAKTFPSWDNSGGLFPNIVSAKTNFDDVEIPDNQMVLELERRLMMYVRSDNALDDAENRTFYSGGTSVSTDVSWDNYNPGSNFLGGDRQKLICPGDVLEVSQYNEELDQTFTGRAIVLEAEAMAGEIDLMPDEASVGAPTGDAVGIPYSLRQNYTKRDKVTVSIEGPQGKEFSRIVTEGLL